MPHKVNPIDFENSEGNLELSNALFAFFGDKLSKSRLQRDLSDSTVLRNIGVPFGHSYLAIQSLINGFSKLEVNKEQSLKELNNNWQVLGEAIQTVMKLEGYDDAYEIIKDLTRGELLTENSYKSLINSLDISTKSKSKLLKLTPATYIGLSKSL
jgi:adenylosuccinate lyase